MSYHNWEGHVLLVEDDSALAEASVEILRRAGLLVQHASTLAEALAMAVPALPTSPECILLDLGLPDVDQHSANRGDSVFALRRVNPDCALVVLTGSTIELPEMLAGHYVQAWCSKGEAPSLLPWIVRCAVAHMRGIHSGIEAAVASRETRGPK